ncbi:hypothetical protein ABPG77_011441 [Micractinium sp. CCAP 211/92]
MGGGLAPAAAAGRAAEYKGRVTWYVLFTALIASSGGLLFGYDLGVTGGVEASSTFLALFFPDVAASKQEYKHSSDAHNPYCEYDSATLSLFTSSLFLAAMAASLPASYVTRRLGRKASMVVGGLWYLLGGALSAGAQNLGMLVAGRIFLGFGVGFANQSVPVYLSEMAPFHARGALNILFQLATTTGVLTAQLVNYALRDYAWGWRLSLGLACGPAALLALGGALLPDSPAGLMERGRAGDARAVLQRIRGTQEVDAELADLSDAAATAASVTQLQAFRNILTRREFSPQLALGVLIPTFQQWTGLNAIVFFVPQLFAALGTGSDAALLNAVVIGGANVGGTLVSILLADRVGRRALLLQAGVQMAGALTGVAALVGSSLGGHPASALPKGTVWATLALVCVFVLGYSWS